MKWLLQTGSLRILLRRQWFFIRDLHAMNWLWEDSGEELTRQGDSKYKGKPPNDLRSLLKKKNLRIHAFVCLLFKFKEYNDPIKDGPAK